MCKMKFQICKKSSSNQLTWWLFSGSVEFNKLANYRNMKKKNRKEKHNESVLESECRKWQHVECRVLRRIQQRTMEGSKKMKKNEISNQIFIFFLSSVLLCVCFLICWAVFSFFFVGIHGKVNLHPTRPMNFIHSESSLERLTVFR